MSKSTHIEPPAIIEVPIKELVIDQSLSGRSKKEITTNAKSLAPAMANGWDATQPGAFFEREGKKHLARGFTRIAAAEIAEVKTAFLVEVPDDPATLRTEAIRSNRGQPISRFEQGKIYAGMRDGTPDAENQPVGSVVLSAMTVEAIGEEVGYTKEHVRQCICIFESPEEVRALLEEERVSPDAVLEARKLAKKKDAKDGEVDDAKLLKVLNAAMKAATAEDKDCATKKHVAAVKEQFAPKLVAETGKKKAPATADNSDGEKSGGETEQVEEAPAASEPPREQAESVLDFGKTDESPKQQSKAEVKTAKETFLAIMAKWDEEASVAASDEDIEDLWTRLTDAGFRLHQSPL